eukprot:TRINITY_DN3075_c0_g1_i2.p1 TRINITY_DN3075_c0_g1~~TRINITY_DN3075_c0_g1_i2.p1  ORF type:complete len:107 (-),score=23.25 TRINITY_DN3075_c0_g1_i2:83-403(-)
MRLPNGFQDLEPIDGEDWLQQGNGPRLANDLQDLAELGAGSVDVANFGGVRDDEKVRGLAVGVQQLMHLSGVGGCLLYTSDAADEEDSVDLGGRRIIKKKNKVTRR